MRELIAEPQIVTFSDYRDFLRAFFDWKKNSSGKFSHRRFAQLADIKSSNYLMLVMNRQRNLSESKARMVARAMKLSKLEADHFVSMVRLTNAKSSDAAEAANHAILKTKRQIARKLISQEKAFYLSSWYIPLVRELIFIRDFNPSSAWIVKALDNLISKKEADTAIRVLINLGFWVEDYDGRLLPADVVVDTGPEELGFSGVVVSKIHKDNLTAWTKIIENIPRSQRELGLLNIPINSSKIPELKIRIQNFQNELIDWLQDEKAADQLVQVGSYMIPVTGAKVRRA